MKREYKIATAAFGGYPARGEAAFGLCGGRCAAESIDSVFSQVRRELQESAERDRIEREIATYAKRKRQSRSA